MPTKKLPPRRVWIEIGSEFTSFDPATQTPGNPSATYSVNLYQVDDGIPYISLSEHESLLSIAKEEARREGEARMAQYLLGKMARLCSSWSDKATAYMKIDIANWRATEPAEKGE
jgi:hypothetical protein